MSYGLCFRSPRGSSSRFFLPFFKTSLPLFCRPSVVRFHFCSRLRFFLNVFFLSYLFFLAQPSPDGARFPTNGFYFFSLPPALGVPLFSWTAHFFVFFPFWFGMYLTLFRLFFQSAWRLCINFLHSLLPVNRSDLLSCCSHIP